MILAERYHDISCGHRVAGHESKCAHLHGHNYRIHFTCAMIPYVATAIGNAMTLREKADELDALGRVLDFSAIKEMLCMWLENNWDHKFLAWTDDPLLRAMFNASVRDSGDLDAMITDSIVWVPFNPTAEKMAQYLLTVIGPQQLKDTGVELIRVRVDETRKCSAEAIAEDDWKIES